MDSVSHIVIGSAIGELTLGKKIGRWGMLAGAIAKSIPDFDLFYTGLNDPRAYMCEHRAHTHSLIIEALYALPLAWLLVRIFKNKFSFLRSYLFFMLCLWGHSLLDTCTAFGTQLLLPFTNTAYRINTIAIVDLLFTFPMILLCLIAVFKRSEEKRHKLSRALLIWCGIYLGFTFVNKIRAISFAKDSIATANIPAKKYMTNPTMLNNLLWYAVAANDSDVFVGEFSLYKKDSMNWHRYSRHTEWMKQSKSTKDVAVMDWFSGPFTIAQKEADTLRIYAVKFGRTNLREDSIHKTFVFHYRLWQENGVEKMSMHRGGENDMSMKEGVQDLWERMW